MKHLSNKSTCSIIWALVIVLIIYVVIEKVLKSEPAILTVPFSKTIKIPVLDKTLMAQKIDSMGRIARADFEKELAFELSQMKPEIKEVFLEAIKEPIKDSLIIMYSESIVFDTLNIDGFLVFNKYLIGAKTINYPPVNLRIKRFENNFVYRDTIYVEQYQSKLKKLGNWTVKGLAIIGAIKVVEMK